MKHFGIWFKKRPKTEENIFLFDSFIYKFS